MVDTSSFDLGRKVYQWTERKIRHDLKAVCSTWEVWPRNSFLTSAFRPFKSDLDLTLWMKTPPTAKQQEKLRRSLRRAKRIFPLLGECNVYVEELVTASAQWQNVFEGQRDPFSFNRLPKSAGELSLEAQRSAFLLRMLDADRRNLQTSPHRRVKKWTLHLQSVNDPNVEKVFDPNRPFDSVLGVVFYWLLREKEPAFLYHSINDTKKLLLKNKIMEGDPVSPVWAALFPHRFTSYEIPGSLELESFFEITKAQLFWELWGMQSQFLLRTDFQEVLGHLSRLSRFCEVAGQRVSGVRAAEFKDLARSFDSLGERMRPIHFSTENGR